MTQVRSSDHDAPRPRGTGELAVNQNQRACLARHRGTTVLAAPGYSGSWPAGRPSDRIGRAFIIAAARAGADAVELDAPIATPQLFECAREHALLAVARIASAQEIRQAADAGIETFCIEGAIDDLLIQALAEAAACVILNNAAAQAAPLLRNHGIETVILKPHDEFLQEILSPDPRPPQSGPHLGCEIGSAAISAAGAVLAAACRARIIRQRLAVARFPARNNGPQALSQKKFKEMVDNIRAAEKILGRHAPTPRELNTGRGFAIIASQIVANVVVVIDFTETPRLRPDALELLLSRLEKAHNVDTAAAIAPAQLAQSTQRMLAYHKVACYPYHKTWLDAILAVAHETDADAIVWLPARNVLIDPALLDRLIAQHVKSASDYTICPDLPRGLAAEALSVAALRRIAALTDANADAPTTFSLLANRRVFRVHEIILPPEQRRPDLDLTWNEAVKDLFDTVVRTGAETTDDLISRFSIFQPHRTATTTEGGDPGADYSFVGAAQPATSTI